MIPVWMFAALKYILLFGIVTYFAGRIWNIVGDDFKATGGKIKQLLRKEPNNSGGTTRGIPESIDYREIYEKKG